MTPAVSWSPADFRDAFARCHDAWRATQPQLFLTDDDLYGLDEAQPSALRLVEPAGFTNGAEPRCATPEALTASCAAPPATPNAGGSAPLSFDGPGRVSIEDSHGLGLGGER